MNISELLEREATDLEAEFAGLVADDATPRVIRRRRAVRQGATAGVAVFGVGALALGGLRLGGWDAPEPGSPDASAGPPPDITQALQIDPNADPRYSPWATVPACGEPAPAVVTDDAGLRLHLRGPEELALSPLRRIDGADVRASVTNVSAEGATLHISPLVHVWTQAGTVVAYSTSPITEWAVGEPRIGALEVGRTANMATHLRTQTYYCDAPAAGPWSTLDRGNYEVYPVVRVVGSVDGTDGLAREPIDVTLTTKPVRVELTGSWQTTMADRAAATKTNFPESPQCGAPAPYPVTDSSRVWAWAMRTDESDAPWDVGDRVTIAVYSDQLVSPTTVALPARVDVWLVAIDGWDRSEQRAQRVIAGHAVLQPGHGQEANLENLRDSGEISASVVEWNVCFEPANGFYDFVLDTDVIWTDVNGTEAVPTLPR